MLSDRRQRVLAALIEEYVAQALPVGSRTLTERYRLGVSPATVRNELSYLEENGYISQPHTSAGRIPTDFGYRAFVDNLLESQPASDDAVVRDAIEQLRGSANELDALLEQASRALAQLTDCLSIVLAPAAAAAAVKQVTLVSLSEHRGLVVLITKDGQVFNRPIDFGESVAPDELERVERSLNRLFAGRSLRDIDSDSVSEAARALESPLALLVLDEVVACLHEHEMAHARRLGMSSLMRKPEFKHSQSLIPIMQALEDDTVLFEILDPDNHRDAAGAPLVRIGHENPTEQLAGVSVVANRYGRGDAAGVVAVIGPTRMDYSKALRAVRIASAALQDE